MEISITLHRFHTVIAQCATKGLGCNELPFLIESICRVADCLNTIEGKEVKNEMLQIAMSLAFVIRVERDRSIALSRISSITGGSRMLKNKMTSIENSHKDEVEKPDRLNKSYFDRIMFLEKSLKIGLPTDTTIPVISS